MDPCSRHLARLGLFELLLDSTTNMTFLVRQEICKRDATDTPGKRGLDGLASLQGLLKTRSLGSLRTGRRRSVVYSHAPVAGRRGLAALSVPYEV